MGSDEPGPGQQYALQARKHIASLRKARPGIIIEIRWCPAHKGIAGNEKADEWTKIAAEERTKAKVAPWLPRSLAKLKREITEKKWVEARHWAGTRTPKTKYRMTKIQRPDGVVAGSTKRLASRSYQLKMGHCLTGQYLSWTENRPSAQCRWFPYRTQMRENVLINCPHWKMQQRELWAKVRVETAKWEDRFTIRDLVADDRCSQVVVNGTYCATPGCASPHWRVPAIRRI